jgi:hypothetical protein
MLLRLRRAAISCHSRCLRGCIAWLCGHCSTSGTGVGSSRRSRHGIGCHIQAGGCVGKRSQAQHLGLLLLLLLLLLPCWSG